MAVQNKCNLMKEAIIKYDNPKTLDILKSLAKYFDFSISSVKDAKQNDSQREIKYINGIPYIEGNAAIDIAELSEIFTGKNIDAKKIRKEEWQRKK
jgi:histidinol phosphatase-like PHP family hydrolase